MRSKSDDKTPIKYALEACCCSGDKDEDERAY